MHDEDCQLPSLDWLTNSVKRKSSTLYIPDPLVSHFSQHTKRSRIHHCQKNAPKDVDFSKEAIKPPYSYAELITLAMRHHGQSKVLLSDIYEYVRKNFAWYRKTDITWQNSIRHNLSLNKQFIKLPRKKGEKGKGSYWMLDQNALDSGLKMKKNGSTNGKMKVLERDCKPTLNPAILSYLKKQTEPEKQSNLDSLRLTNLSSYSPQIMEIGAEEAIRLEDVELTTVVHSFSSAIDENVSFHLSSVSPSAISGLTEYENEQTTDPGNNYYQLQTIIEHDKSPVWWRNEENATFLNSPHFGQPPLPRFTDAFANGSFENPVNSNVESEEHPWQEVDLKITDECLFFDLSM